MQYGAEILAAGIEDNPENFTRFFLVRRAVEVQADPESNKISLAFSVENRPGSLVAVLNELAALGTNLTKIESRPVHGKPWEYVFYVDCQIQSSDEGSRALEALTSIAPWSRSWGDTGRRRCKAGQAGPEIRCQEFGSQVSAARPGVPNPKTPFKNVLEVIGDANDGIADDGVPPVGGELGIAKCGHLGDPSAILDADVEAGA